MKKVILKNDGCNTKLEIDGIEMQGAYSVKIEKTEDGPITLELFGKVTSEVQVET